MGARGMGKLGGEQGREIAACPQLGNAQLHLPALGRHQFLSKALGVGPTRRHGVQTPIRRFDRTVFPDCTEIDVSGLFGKIFCRRPQKGITMGGN
jgi:hypothetical protein